MGRISSGHSGELVRRVLAGEEPKAVAFALGHHHTWACKTLNHKGIKRQWLTESEWNDVKAMRKLTALVVAQATTQ